MKKVYELVDVTKARNEKTVETICIKVSLPSFGGHCSHSGVELPESSFSKQGPADSSVRLKFNRY